MKSHKTFMLLIVMLVLFALFGAALQPAAHAAQPGPVAGPTPVSVTRPAGSGYITFDPFSTAVLTADTASTCFDVGKYSVVDALYSIDQGAINTVTLTTKWSIDGTTTASGVNLVATNAADATDMQQLQVFGRYFCVLADVTNTNAVTITVQAIAK